MHTHCRMLAVIVPAAVVLVLLASGPAAGQITCDSLYYLLQNLAVNHVGGNEVWVEYFLDCPGSPDTVGGFIFSEVNQEGKRDRAVIARYSDRIGWQYRFGERATRIRFAKPSPRMDVDGDGQLDMVFTAADDIYPGERGYRVLFQRPNSLASLPELHFPRGLIIDSILPAPPQHAHALTVADRRGWEIGGLKPPTAPVSHRYLAWERSTDTAKYVNQTAAQTNQFPDMQRRAAYVKALPKSGELRFDAPEKYEEFLINVIGFTLDQSNMAREREGFETISEILDRVRYGGPTGRLQSPREVRDGLLRAMPAQRNLKAMNK